MDATIYNVTEIKKTQRTHTTKSGRKFHVTKLLIETTRYNADSGKDIRTYTEISLLSKTKLPIIKGVD